MINYINKVTNYKYNLHTQNFYLIFFVPFFIQSDHKKKHRKSFVQMARCKITHAKNLKVLEDNITFPV